MVDDGRLVDGRNQAFSDGQARAEGPVNGDEPSDQVEGCSSESSLAAYLQLLSSPERIQVNLKAIMVWNQASTSTIAGLSIEGGESMEGVWP